MIDSYERRGTLVPQEDFKQVVIERKTRQVSKVHLCRACSVPDRFIKRAWGEPVSYTAPWKTRRSHVVTVEWNHIGIKSFLKRAAIMDP